MRGRFGSSAVRALAFAVCSGLGCGGAPPATTPPNPLSALVPSAEGALTRIEVRRLEARPRLTLVSRDGDPYPAVAVSVATDLGPAASTALAAILEQRLSARQLVVTSRADRDAVHLRWSPRDDADPETFLEAVRESFLEPVTPTGGDLALARARLASLARNPLDAPALDKVADCTGQLGVASPHDVPKLAGNEGAAQLDAWRRSALVTGRTSIAAIGRGDFAQSVAEALSDEDGWPLGPEAAPRPRPEASASAATVAPLAPGEAEVTVALRVGDPRRAVAAAERLGAGSSPLSAKLPTLAAPWRVEEVIGSARARGGCVAVTLRSTGPGRGEDLAKNAAEAALLVEREVSAETAVLQEPAIASRQILGATDPRAGAELAAWWALSAAEAADAAATVEGGSIVVLKLGAAEIPEEEIALGPVQANLARALATARPAALRPAALEQQTRVERGQGSFWLLLASRCGALTEGEHDAGVTALAALAAVESAKPPRGVALEAWITPDGIGVLAHGTLADGDTPQSLARRVADAAAQVVVASRIDERGLDRARAKALTHLERYAGPTGEALEAFASRAQPTHPSWIVPMGFRHAASSSLEAVQMRWRDHALTPLRLAVIANADAAQAEAAARTVERWLPAPIVGCAIGAGPPAQPGRVDSDLPSHLVAAQAIVGARVPAEGQPDHPLAELTAWVLQGPDGRLARALASVPGAHADARVLGGRRAAALAVDIRAPADRIAPATKAVGSALDALSRDGLSAEEQKRAWSAYVEHRDTELADPRDRIARLWHGDRPLPAPAPPAAQALSAWLETTLAGGRRIEIVAAPR